MHLEQDFPHLALAAHAGPEPTLQRTVVPPVAILRSGGTTDPRGVLTGETPALLTGVAHLIVDFGRELVGFLEIVASSDHSAEMHVTYGESAEEACDTDGSCDNCSWFHLPQDKHRVTGPARAYRHEGRRAFQYVQIRTTSPGASLRLHSLAMTLVHYPVAERGSFSSSDPLINRIWDLNRYTTMLCMQRFYEDGIKRDGILWVSDYRQQFLANWTPFGDAALARRSLILFAASQMASGFIPACAAAAGAHQHTDAGHVAPEGISYMPNIPFTFGTYKMLLIHYSTDYLSGLLDYVMHTGDMALLDLLWPTVQRLVAAHETHDYPAGSGYATEWNGWNSLGTMLMQVIAGLRNGARLAALRGDEAIRARCHALAERIRQRVQAEHWDAARGYFTDEPVAQAHGAGSLHVNTFALLAGAVDRKDGRPLLDRALAAGARQAEWSGMRMWQHAGEFEAGLATLALQGIRNFWGFMLDQSSSTGWESCDLKPDGGWRKPIISRCHGWGGTASYLLPRYVLGVEPTAPGFSRVAIRPQLGDLAWAHGTVPTPRGAIRVEMDAKAGGKVVAPAGITVEASAGLEIVQG